MDVAGGDNNLVERLEAMGNYSQPSNLTIDVNRNSNFNDDDTNNSPTMFGENDAEKQISTSPRVMRAACDFCHAKRIKCRRDESEPEGGRCLQCIRRNIKCNFSYKEKTGPKPKILRQNKESSSAHSERGKVHIKSEERVKQNFSPLEIKNFPRNPNYTLTVTPSPKEAPKMYDQNLRESTEVQAPNSVEDQLHQERMFLQSYLALVAKLLPFCPEEPLLEAFSQKERSPVPNAVPSTVAQAQLAGALAIGALIRSNRMAESYHYAARAHLRSLFSAPSPEAGSVLCMLAFYWQYKGDDEKKTVYLRHAKLGLDRAPNWLTLELRMCMEHLDYENLTNSFKVGLTLAPRLRALNLVSHILSDIQKLMDPVEGYYSASSYSEQLFECSSSLNVSAGDALPALLCSSLHSFLLIMLGRREDAESVLRRVPSYLESCPDAPRALPLSWDSTLILAMLAFILKMKSTYAVIHSAVEFAQNATAATQWTCQLPSDKQSPNDFLDHQCQSTSNICSIICQVGRTTNCGTESFYSECKKQQQELEINNCNNNSVPLSVPLLPKELEQQVLARQQQAALKEQLQKHYDPKANFAMASQNNNNNNQRRTHFEMLGSNATINEMMPENMFRGSLLNSNQASPVPFTQKRIRNSCTNSPVEGRSPAMVSRGIEQPKQQNLGGGAKKASPSRSESPDSTLGKYAFEYIPVSKETQHSDFSGLIQSMEKFVKSEPQAKENALEGGDSSASCKWDLSGNMNGLKPSGNSSPGYFDMLSGMGLSADSFSKNSPAMESSNPFEVKQESLLENATGNGLLSTLVLNDEQFGGFPLSNVFSEGGINRDDSGYLAFMNDQDLMEVLQDWSIGAGDATVDKKLLMNLKEKSQSASPGPTNSEARGGSKTRQATPALQA